MTSRQEVIRAHAAPRRFKHAMFCRFPFSPSFTLHGTTCFRFHARCHAAAYFPSLFLMFIKYVIFMPFARMVRHMPLRHAFTRMLCAFFSRAITYHFDENERSRFITLPIAGIRFFAMLIAFSPNAALRATVARRFLLPLCLRFDLPRVKHMSCYAFQEKHRRLFTHNVT